MLDSFMEDRAEAEHPGRKSQKCCMRGSLRRDDGRSESVCISDICAVNSVIALRHETVTGQASKSESVARTAGKRGMLLLTSISSCCCTIFCAYSSLQESVAGLRDVFVLKFQLTIFDNLETSQKSQHEPVHGCQTLSASM